MELNQEEKDLILARRKKSTKYSEPLEGVVKEDKYSLSYFIDCLGSEYYNDTFLTKEEFDKKLQLFVKPALAKGDVYFQEIEGGNWTNKACSVDYFMGIEEELDIQTEEATVEL